LDLLFLLPQSDWNGPEIHFGGMEYSEGTRVVIR